ncbi:MBL fold metallo-hydrolase [Aquisalimonas sp. 2447]|uniref:MBL fold metallo-hydrolase n=1 Tax=Aquisalimonas sp. 2447 TaxID=2740807 RepID=UPI0014324C45|nr:MBL fold metallo-hydrolase [Aquisalimonas sp. 2447]QIT54087.1 MBL fold metallo-hydrolase [Aquisalimonas sp. 2447]
MNDSQQQSERVVVGELHRVNPVLARITAPNPGMMTGPGTNTWIVGGEDRVVVDPGPDDPGHLEAVVAAGEGRIRAILVTHAHPDHSPGALRLREMTGASIMAHPAELTGIRDEGLDADQDLDEGDRLDGDDFTLHCLHAPGHASDHLCFLLENDRILLAGDVVMDSNTVVISPPDGNMTDYLATLERLRDLDVDAIAPGHGRLLRPAAAVFQAVIDHRLERERMVLDAVRAGDTLIQDMVARIYTHVPEALQRVARGSVQAHLEKLRVDGLVSGEGQGPWHVPGD